MMPEMLLYVGIAVCGAAVVGAVAAAVLLRVFKSRLDKQLDAEYGKRRE